MVTVELALVRGLVLAPVLALELRVLERAPGRVMALAAVVVALAPERVPVRHSL